MHWRLSARGYFALISIYPQYFDFYFRCKRVLDTRAATWYERAHIRRVVLAMHAHLITSWCSARAHIYHH